MELNDLINSSILEEYTLGIITHEQKMFVEVMIMNHPEVEVALKNTSASFAIYARQFPKNPPRDLKHKLLSKIKNTQVISLPPLLNEHSKITDFDPWIRNIREPEEYDNIYMEYIADYGSVKMLVAWIKEGEKSHAHDQYSENILILEGACTAKIDGMTAGYKKEDYFYIPKHTDHSYVVTSKKAMKVIVMLNLKAS